MCKFIFHVKLFQIMNLKNNMKIVSGSFIRLFNIIKEWLTVHVALFGTNSISKKKVISITIIQ